MRYYLDPFGCVKNQVDAETLMAYLNGAAWCAVDNADDADLIIINSCGFIESAKRESINAVLMWRKRYPDKKIILAGCLAQRYARELELPEADALFGNDGENVAPAARYRAD
jgi:ribosomal protein S12 methylthiotransferase